MQMMMKTLRNSKITTADITDSSRNGKYDSLFLSLDSKLVKAIDIAMYSDSVNLTYLSTVKFSIKNQMNNPIDKTSNPITDA